MPVPWRGRLRWGVWIVVALATAAVRLRLVDQLQRGVRWTVASGDSWYHVRRAAWAAAHGQLPHFDPWVHHPAGNWVVWPDGFDGLIALLARALGTAPDPDHAIVAGIAVVTTAAVATAVLAAEVSARLAASLSPGAWPGVAGLLAGLAVAVHGGLHNYTQAGKIDHHAVEPLLTCAALAALLQALSAPRSWHPPLVAAACLGLVQAMLPSSALTIGLVAAGTWLGWIAAADPLAASRPLAVAFAGAAAIGALLVAVLPAGVPCGWSAEHLSWLQPTLCGLSAVAFWRSVRLPRRWMPWAWLAMVLLPLAVVPPLRTAALSGTGFVGGQGYVAIIAESASAAERGAAATMAQLGWLALSLPLLVVWWWRYRSHATLRVWMSAVLVGLALGLLQARFATLAAVPLAILFAVAAADLAGRQGPRRTLAVGGLCLLPGLTDVTTRPLPPAARRTAVWQALDWLHGHAPLPGDPWDLRTQPGFSVLSSWALGHDLLVQGGQANVCSPLIASGQTEGLRDCLRLHLGQGDDATAILAIKHQARWWLTVPLSLSAMRAYATALGEPADRYARAGADGGWAATAEGQCATAQVLQQGNGSASADGSCAARPDWRLAFAAADGRAKLFERVAAARLVGRDCPAHHAVRLTARLRVRGEGVLWLQQVQADERGQWRMRVPWSTGYATSTVQLIDMTVDCGKPYAIRVDEAAVRRGSAVLALPADATAATALPADPTAPSDGTFPFHPGAARGGHVHDHGEDHRHDPDLAPGHAPAGRHGP
jgi:hypothetical protein